ncbi:EF-hand domain-containing protein D2 isoform X6 [Epinephelus lanceolatus]|uniref:EF-hand domain-containing protein D1 isoform X6 n=1 Tax=Epinephelus lanceolatus TaxID=310571 RepID=UPI0014466FE5|nr:EF-hand domain-containing protein D1 isoform X6 [Epinephelus lanceolatus]
MASEELARKLQSRLVATWEDEPRPEPVQSLAQPNPQEAEAACGESSSELSAKLIRRQDINEGNAAPRLTRIFNPYTEFKEFSRKQIKDMEMMFKRYDTGKDGFIDLMELKLMMEKLGAPQTHLGLKNMIKEVDEDFDGKLSFREMQALSLGSKFEAEIREEKEERKRQEVEKKQRQAAFKQLQSTFCS